MKKISIYFLAIFLVFSSFKINAQCVSGETEIDFVASGVSGGWSDYAVLMGSASSYLINTPGSNLECITNGLCYTVTLAGSAILEIYQAGILVATPTNGETICFPFVPSNNGCTDILACNYSAAATIDDNSCIYPSSSIDFVGLHCDSYTWIDGVTYTASNNTATFTTPNTVGCDSVITLDLTVNYSTTTSDNQVACDAYSWIDGVTYTASNNTAIFTSTNAAGCDSVISLDLTVNHSTMSTDNQVVCDTYTWIDGVNYTASNNTATFMFNTVDGCDSVVTLDLTVVYSVVWTHGFSICDGYSVVVGSSVYDSTGNYIDTLTAGNGCDSIVNTYLMIDENTSSYDTLSVTASIVWNGIPLNVSGDYSVTLINSSGCDSIVNLNLTVATTGILDIANNKSNLVKITDVLGQETPYRRNTPLFYIYDDGTVEKRIIIE